jgi:hypothetical protein
MAAKDVIGRALTSKLGSECGTQGGLIVEPVKSVK